MVSGAAKLAKVEQLGVRIFLDGARFERSCERVNCLVELVQRTEPAGPRAHPHNGDFRKPHFQPHRPLNQESVTVNVPSTLVCEVPMQWGIAG
jgi:hypothetical protein